jgi:L-alanine-DL-glutamate epimerase-like enolase superfamily enzyme
VHEVGNTLVSWQIQCGDVAGALAAADVVVEGEYRTQHAEHAYLEPEAGVGWLENGVLTLRVPLEGSRSEPRVAAFWRELASESQLRWLGPEKGVIHLATAAVVNALWDLYARMEGKPLWKVLADMTPEQIVSCVPFSYISDALTPEEAVAILKRHEPTKQQRTDKMLAVGYPAYTTSAGWLGYSDEKVRMLVREGIERGWTHFKMKVGRNLKDDLRRARLIRDEIGWDRKLMMDANQVWEVSEAIRYMKELAQFRPYWIEEPTSPDDVLGHARIARAIEPIGEIVRRLRQPVRDRAHPFGQDADREGNSAEDHHQASDQKYKRIGLLDINHQAGKSKSQSIHGRDSCQKR